MSDFSKEAKRISDLFIEADKKKIKGKEVL